MKLPIEWRPEARFDLAKARFYYDLERPGLGREFVAEVETLLQRIAEFPQAIPNRFCRCAPNDRSSLLI